MIHAGNGNAALFLTVGSSQPTGLTINANIALAYGWGTKEKEDDPDPNTIYANGITNVAESGTVANRNVTDPASLQFLLGYQRSENNLLHLTGGSYGVEAFAAHNISASNVSSDTFGGNAYLNLSIGRRTFGIAAGGSYETNGGGTALFLRLGIALDSNGGPRPILPPIPAPGSLVEPFNSTGF